MVTVVKKWGNSLGIRSAVTIEARDWQVIQRRECARKQNGQLRA